ncbi:MAG: UDP-N-acetylmuramoyl-tripeptide--D-alanyl-D-alanine ligase [Prevotellaceae bacterium]|nr:UDP-N-acetylmuramoyl-tripeptide--D-alanyl-D-alanine ligase [Prevotellaceae bacterium]
MDIATLYRLFQACHGVTTDSRDTPQGSLFVALKGSNFNGNAFAASALEKGCRYAVVDDARYIPDGDKRYLLVDDCLPALQALARHHRRQMGTRIVAITGTNGKTTTKELVAAVLSQSFHILYTQGNLNNAIGVPLTLLKLKPEHEIGVIEMGASHPGDIRELVEIAEPDYGLITNVGKAHLLGFGSFEGVMRTKGELYDFLRRRGKATIFLHDDNPYLKQMAQGLHAVSYGTAEGLYVNGKVTGNSPYLAFDWHADRDATAHHVQTRLIGEYNFSNALAAVTVGRFFGVPAGKIDQAIAAYRPQNNRSELKQTADNTLVIDAYNANPTSMRAALTHFHGMQAPHKMVILGDMRELGSESAMEHQAIVELVESFGFERVWLVGSEFAATRHSYPTYADAAALIAALRQEKPHGMTILLKGSNSMKLSSVTDYL